MREISTNAVITIGAKRCSAVMRSEKKKKKKKK